MRREGGRGGPQADPYGGRGKIDHHDAGQDDVSGAGISDDRRGGGYNGGDYFSGGGRGAGGLTKQHLNHHEEPTAASLELVHTLGLSATASQSLAFSPTTPGLIAYPAGVHVVLYDIQSQRQVQFLRARTVPHHPISSAAFSKDGQLLAAGQKGHSPAILLWDVSSGRCVQEMRGHKVGVAAVAWSPDGRYLVSAGLEHDGHVCLWDWTTGTLLCKQYTQSSLTAITFSEDLSVVSVGKEHFKVWGVAAADAAVRPSGNSNISLVPKKPANLKDHRSATFVGVCACATPPDSGAAATGVYALTSAGWLILMRAASRTMDKSVDLQVRAAYGLGVSLTQVACACASGVVRIFAVRTLQFKGSLPRPAMKSHQGWLPASASAALGQNIPGRPTASTADVFPDAVGCCFNLSGTQLTVAYSDQSVFVWDVSDMSTVSRLHHLGGHSSGIWDLALFPGSFSDAASPVHGDQHTPCSHLATCAADGTIRVWTMGPNSRDADEAYHVGLVGVLGAQASDAVQAAHTKYDADTPLPKPGSNGSGAHHRVMLRCLCVSMQAMHLAVGDHLGRLRVYDLHTMNLLVMQEAHEAEILCLDYSPGAQDGTCLLASGARDMRVHVYDARHDYRHIASYDDHCAGVTAIRFCMGGNRLVSCGSDRNIIFRNLSSGGRESTAAYKIENVPRCAMQDLLVDPMDRHALTVGQDSIVRVWDIASGQLLRTIPCDPSAGEILRLAMDPGGSVLACCNSEGGVQLFDYSTSQLLATCTGHGDRVTAAAVLPDCKGLISVGQDGCILVWQLPLPLQQQMQKAAAMKSKKMLNVRQKLTRGGQQDEPDGLLVRVAQGKPLLNSEQLPKWAQSTPAAQKGEDVKPDEGATLAPSSRWTVNVGQDVTIHSDIATPATFKIGQRVPVQSSTPLTTPSAVTSASSSELPDQVEEDLDAPLLASVNFSEASFMTKKLKANITNWREQDTAKNAEDAAATTAAPSTDALPSTASVGNKSLLHTASGSSKVTYQNVSNLGMSSFVAAATAAAQAAGIVATTQLEPQTSSIDTQTDSPVAGLQSNSQAGDGKDRPVVKPSADGATGATVEVESAFVLPPRPEGGAEDGSDDSGERALIRAVQAASRTHSEDDEVQYYECSTADHGAPKSAAKGGHEREAHLPLDGRAANTDSLHRDGIAAPLRLQTDPPKKTYLARAQSAVTSTSSAGSVPSADSTPTAAQQQPSPSTEDLPLTRMHSAMMAGEVARPSRMHADLERMRERLQGLHRDFCQQENMRSAGKRTASSRGQAVDAQGNPVPLSPFSPTSVPKSYPTLAAESSGITTPHDSPSNLPSPSGTPMDIDLPDSPTSVNTHMTSELDNAGRDTHPLYGTEVSRSVDARRTFTRTGSRPRTRTPSPAPRPPAESNHSGDVQAQGETSAPLRNLPGNLVSNIHQRQLSLPAIKSAPSSSGQPAQAGTPAADSSYSSPADSAHSGPSASGAPQPNLIINTTAPVSPTFSTTKPPSSRSHSATQSPVPSPPSRSPPSSTAFMCSPQGSRSTTPPTSRSVSTSLEATFSSNLIQRSLDALSSHPVEVTNADLPPLPAPSNTDTHSSSTAQHSIPHIEQHTTQRDPSPQQARKSPPLSPQAIPPLSLNEEDDSAKVWASLAEVISAPSSPLVSQSQTVIDRRRLSGSAIIGSNPRTPRSRNASPGLNKKFSQTGANNKSRESQPKESDQRDLSLSHDDYRVIKAAKSGSDTLSLSNSARQLSSLRASYPGDQVQSTDPTGLPHSVPVYEAALERFSAAAAELLSRWQELQSLHTRQISDPGSSLSPSVAAASKLQASYHQVLETTQAAIAHSLPATTSPSPPAPSAGQPNRLFTPQEHQCHMSSSQLSAGTHGTTTGSAWDEHTERIAELVAQRVHEKQAALLQELVALQTQQQVGVKGVSKQRAVEKKSHK